ncbi:aldo/keto reductase [Candidatus Thorarchaeota archaeon]|nr:MAG: aldo/keto reductase [Candidatus Thorarchaeota archaeon]
MSNLPRNRLEANGVYLSQIGLGIEHFARGVRKVKHLTKEEHSKHILKDAFKLGVTHYDLVFNLPYFFDVFREFMSDKREKVTFTAHLGNVYDFEKDRNMLSRNLKHIERSFDGMMEQLDVDSVDIALMQYVRNIEDYEKIKKNGIIEYLHHLKEDGRAKTIGVSGHTPLLLSKIIDDGEYDVIMFPLNFATGYLETTKNLINKCKEQQIAVIGIKTLLKGKLFTTKKTDLAAYYSGGRRYSLKLSESATPSQCINYALDFGADTIVFGVKTVEELVENVHSFTSGKGLNNYQELVKLFDK